MPDSPPGRPPGPILMGLDRDDCLTLVAFLNGVIPTLDPQGPAPGPEARAWVLAFARAWRDRLRAALDAAPPDPAQALRDPQG